MATKGLQAWVNRLSKKEMPVLANVVTELNKLTGDDETGVNQLADVILKDANLTSQVLRIANSVHYNPSSYPINTVSRAIILIGFTGIRAICISVMMIDSLLGKHPRQRLLSHLASAFHAAVQARQLMGNTHEEVREEVFIAALLFHLGAMAFWSVGGESADQLDQLLQADELSEKEAVDEVLGCSFKALTKSLAGRWNLGDTLGQALYPDKKPSPMVQAVRLGEEINQAALDGWDTAAMNAVLVRVAEFLDITTDDARRLVERTADQTAAVALSYGAAPICHLIPSREREERLSEELEQPEPLKSNPELQLNILRDLTNAMLENLDVNAIFQMVLEGLHRGVGLERVTLAFVQKNSLSAKFILGEGTEDWREKFEFATSPTERSLFSHAIQKQEPVWVSREMISPGGKLYNAESAQVLGSCPAFVSGIYLGPRCIALFYADRWTLGGNLTEEQFQSFRHFMLQTQMCLKMLAERPPA